MCDGGLQLSTMNSACVTSVSTALPGGNSGQDLSYEGRVRVVAPGPGLEATMAAARELERALELERPLTTWHTQGVPDGSYTKDQERFVASPSRIELLKPLKLEKIEHQPHFRERQKVDQPEIVKDESVEPLTYMNVDRQQSKCEQPSEHSINPPNQDKIIDCSSPYNSCSPDHDQESSQSDSPNRNEVQPGAGGLLNNPLNPYRPTSTSPVVDLPGSPHSTMAQDSQSPPRSYYDDDSSHMCDDGDDDRVDPLRRLQFALEKNGMLGSIYSGGPGDEEITDEGGNKVFQCPLCSYTGSSRYHFGVHLNTHYDHKCTICDFTAKTDIKLRAHIRESHDVTVDADDEAGVRIPRVNSQGKVKTFRCKQCEFVSVTKLEFWEHSRSHIKAEKLLTCPKCPFVTEYKHHLEYHLRNHFGSKPFKCQKCSYSCVNKSMLNSHMKSHSNIYQYRCLDCNYATKYCHSLKLHLRKYGHKPSMVLNPDGTPNPLPIIDVYGTRRGPKIKRDDGGIPHLSPHMFPSLQASYPPTQVSSAGGPYHYTMSLLNGGSYIHTPPAASVPQRLEERSNTPVQDDAEPFSAEEQAKSQQLDKHPSTTRVVPLKCGLCDYSSSHRDQFSHHMMMHAATENSEQTKISPESPKPITVKETSELQTYSPPLHSLKKSDGTLSTSGVSSPLQIASKDFFLGPHMMTHHMLQFNPLMCNPMQISTQNIRPLLHHNNILEYQSAQEKNRPPMEPATVGTSGTPLDLSKDSRSEDQGSSPAVGKNRRKGKAFKLERIALRLQEQRHSLSPPEVQRDLPPSPLSQETEMAPSETQEKPLENSSKESLWDEAYQCSYCDIAFKDIVMYTMHMGYHGYQDPFKCNMCGQETPDKVAFFIHIARSSHC